MLTGDFIKRGDVCFSDLMFMVRPYLHGFPYPDRGQLHFQILQSLAVLDSLCLLSVLFINYWGVECLPSQSKSLRPIPNIVSQECWYIPVTPALGRWRPGEQTFKVILSHTASPMAVKTTQEESSWGIGIWGDL